MAVVGIELPDGCWRQATEATGVDASGSATFNYVAKGGYDALETLMGSISQGTEIVEGWIAQSMQLQRGKGGSGTLTITCVPSIEEDEDENQVPLKDIWSIKSVRNDISVMAYCGPSGGQNPLRELLEGWMKESDGDLAASNSFRKPNGEIRAITEAPTLALLAKIRKGVDSVIRFYPVVTRKRVYQSCPPTCLENLGYIDTPNCTGTPGLTKKSNGLATAISAHQWLKCQDDCDETEDGNWQRVESWMGIAKDDNNSGTPWDSDLYGANRWEMPYCAN